MVIQEGKQPLNVGANERRCNDAWGKDVIFSYRLQSKNALINSNAIIIEALDWLLIRKTQRSLLSRSTNKTNRRARAKRASGTNSRVFYFYYRFALLRFAFLSFALSLSPSLPLSLPYDGLIDLVTSRSQTQFSGYFSTIGEFRGTWIALSYETSSTLMYRDVITFRSTINFCIRYELASTSYSYPAYAAITRSYVSYHRLISSTAESTTARCTENYIFCFQSQPISSFLQIIFSLRGYILSDV